jgi:hypothetical protein
MVKKAPEARSCGSGRASDAAPPSPAVPRWKAPRVGERRISSRKSGVARPSRRGCGASSRDGGEPALSPASLRTGRRTVLATRGAWSDRGWGKVSAVSNHGGERRDRFISTPGPAYLRRSPRWRGNSRSIGSRPNRQFGGPGCSSGPWSCSWKQTFAEAAAAHAACQTLAKSDAR